MRKLYMCVMTLLLCSNVNAENLIRSLWNKVKNNQQDISEKHDGISRQDVGPFYFYRLNQNKTTHTETQPAVQVVQVEQHPDTVPVIKVIDTTPKSDEVSEVSVKAEKQAVYGEDSPLRDDAVSAAWDRVNEAEKRLEAHRKYMERVRKARKNIEQSKRVAGDISQNDE